MGEKSVNGFTPSASPARVGTLASDRRIRHCLPGSFQFRSDLRCRPERFPST